MINLQLINLILSKEKKTNACERPLKDNDLRRRNRLRSLLCFKNGWHGLLSTEKARSRAILGPYQFSKYNGGWLEGCLKRCIYLRWTIQAPRYEEAKCQAAFNRWQRLLNASGSLLFIFEQGPERTKPREGDFGETSHELTYLRHHEK